MWNSILWLIQALLIMASVILLWQIWHLFKRKDIPDDEPLSEHWSKYLRVRLAVLSILIAMYTVVSILHRILRFFDIL